MGLIYRSGEYRRAEYRNAKAKGARRPNDVDNDTDTNGWVNSVLWNINR